MYVVTHKDDGSIAWNWGIMFGTLKDSKKKISKFKYLQIRKFPKLLESYKISK